MFLSLLVAVTPQVYSGKKNLLKKQAKLVQAPGNLRIVLIEEDSFGLHDIHWVWLSTARHISEVVDVGQL